MAKFADYMASLDELESYPETLVTDLTGAYDEDFAAEASARAVLETEIVRLTSLVEALQTTNSQLISAIGIPTDNTPDDHDNEDDDAAELARAESITLDDLLEGEE